MSEDSGRAVEPFTQEMRKGDRLFIRGAVVTVTQIGLGRVVVTVGDDVDGEAP